MTTRALAQKSLSFRVVKNPYITDRSATISFMYGNISQIVTVIQAGRTDISEETYPRRLVIEEGTGTWCPWCIRGIVAMEHMKEVYPENFIGIAIHDSDEMDFYSKYGLSFDRFPKAYYNRSAYNSVSNSDFEYYFKRMGLTTDKMVSINAISRNENASEVNVKTTTRFAHNYPNSSLRLIYVFTEDNVGPFYQSNGYSGSDESMGGYEKMDKYVSVIYNDVARGIYPDIDGKKESVPRDIEMYTDYKYSFNIPLPGKYSNYEELYLTVMLYDINSGEIVNADRRKISDK